MLYLLPKHTAEDSETSVRIPIRSLVFHKWKRRVRKTSGISPSPELVGQIGLGEFLYFGAGSSFGPGSPTYSTFGWELRLDRLVRCLMFLKLLSPQPPVAEFLLSHIDLHYDLGKAYGGSNGNEKSEDLNLMVG